MRGRPRNTDLSDDHIKRDINFTVRMNEDDYAKLEALSQLNGVCKSDILRDLMVREWIKTFSLSE